MIATKPLSFSAARAFLTAFIHEPTLIANLALPAALVFLLVCAAVPLGMIAAARLLRVKAKTDSPGKFDNYECGEEPDGMAWVRFHPRYYIVALVFVLFDVEAAFLFPWALNLRSMGGIAIIDMFVFLTILFIGWAYAVRKGALKWQ